MSITLGQILTWLSAVAGGIAAVGAITVFCRKMILNLIKEPLDKMREDDERSCNDVKERLNTLLDEIERLNDRIDKTNESIKSVNMNYIKSFLVNVLSSVERGVKLTDIEKLRFSEEYSYYIDHKGNSYIKEWYEDLHTKGLI